MKFARLPQVQRGREGPRRRAGAFAVDWAEVGDRIMEAIYLEPKTLKGIGRRQREGTTW
jgi:hypothetical protein